MPLVLVRGILIHLAIDAAQQRCGLPRLTDIVVHIDDVVAWFVAMGILADETADIGGGIFAEVAMYDKEGIEFLCELLLTAEETHEAMDIMRHEPRILPRIALGEVVEAMHGVERIERSAELSFAVHTAHEIHAFVEIMSVALAAREEIVVVVGLAEDLRHLCGTPVSKGIFEAFSGGLVRRVLIEGDIAVLPEALSVHAHREAGKS